MRCKVLLISAISLLFSLGIFAQTGKLFDADNLLPSSFINQVYLDRDGFVWVATRNGLSRYDGYQSQIFKKGQDNNMASSYVNYIKQDSHGLFYVGMYGALQSFDGSNFSDVKVKDLKGNEVTCYVTCITERHSGEMLAGTSGHGLLQIDSRTEAHQLNGDLRNIHTINAMMEDRDGRMWLVTEGQGVLVWEKGKVTARYAESATGDSEVLCACQDRDGRIFVGTNDHGLMQLVGGEFRHIEATGHRCVASLCSLHDGRLMVGFDGNGVGIYAPSTGELIDNPYYSTQIDLSLSKVVSIAEDMMGNVWLGMLQKGVYMQPSDSKDFSYMGYKLGARNLIGQACVTSTLIDSQERIWVGTDKDGLYLFDKSHKPLRHYKENFPETILSLLEDKQGRVWAGSYQQGCGWIGSDGAYHPQPLNVGARTSAFGLATDIKGNIWIGTMGEGLLRLSPDGQLKSYTTREEAAHNRKVNTLVNDYINKLSSSPDGRRIYVATTLGLCCIDVERDSWVSVFGGNCLNYNEPTRVAKEYGGQLWVGTNDRLFGYDLATHKTREVDQFMGVASLECDKGGKLWVGTDRGLHCFDPVSNQIESYFVDNGLQSNEFSDGASSSTVNGGMLFGGVGGVTWFNPQKLAKTPWKASAKLVGLAVNGVLVKSGTRSGHYQVCDTTVIASDRFDLSSHDSSFTMLLSTLTYDNPEHIVYIYSINNEPPVRLTPGQNEVTFSHLPPGTYHFSVKAERNGQLTEARTFTVVIHNPWWRTWWAYCLYALALGLLVWQYVQLRNRREQDHLRLQEHIHAEEMGEAKLKFFMNISHEIRTPMTLILTPLLSLMKQDPDEQRQTVYQTIRRNAERILSLLNQLMDLRKIDKGAMQMRMQKTDLVGFVADIYSLFEHQARAKHIQFTYEHTDEELPVWVDRKHFDKVIVNILSNAFKFTPAKGEVAINVSHDDASAIIAVRDNGEQIPPDKLERIFERFYQTPSSVNDRNLGTGIGLDLTRSLVELHHGTITARNLEQGCEFTVVIPLGCEHLSPEEMANEADVSPSAALIQMEEMTASDEEEEAKPDRRATIVVAEDDDEIRDYLESELGADYDVVSCRNGREALAEVHKVRPDLVLTDVMMPEMDGNTLCVTLKTNPQTSHLPVVLLTARNRDEDHLEGLETGADAYVVKPFNLEILRATINNLISSRRQLKLKYGRTDQLEQQVEQVEMKSPDEKLLERVMRVINQNLSNSDLSVDKIASEVGISRVHLHRKMKELTGQTPHEFVRNLRLKQAANLLASGDMNVTEVVYACGFGNVPSFSTTFKKFYGMTPREYMQEHQK